LPGDDALAKADRVQVTTLPAETVLAFALFVIIAALEDEEIIKENSKNTKSPILFNAE
jgi:hypothetical protein